MLIRSNAAVESPIMANRTPATADAGKIKLGGACRLPVKTKDAGKIRLGGACRLPLMDA